MTTTNAPHNPGEYRIEVERQGSQEGDFLRTLHRRLRHRRPDGSFSKLYQCDSVLRTMGMDAVAMILHYPDAAGSPVVGLRTSRRPALLLDRPDLPDRPADGLLWEIPAGILEAEDHGEAGRRHRCALEALEEMGAEVEDGAFSPLGPPVWLSPGVMAEQVFLYHAAIPAPGRARPEGDGSPMEEDVQVAWVPLAEALARCALGGTDAKTELALRRFAALVGV